MKHYPDTRCAVTAALLMMTSLVLCRTFAIFQAKDLLIKAAGPVSFIFYAHFGGVLIRECTNVTFVGGAGWSLDRKPPPYAQVTVTAITADQVTFHLDNGTQDPRLLTPGPDPSGGGGDHGASGTISPLVWIYDAIDPGVLPPNLMKGACPSLDHTKVQHVSGGGGSNGGSGDNGGGNCDGGVHGVCSSGDGSAASGDGGVGVDGNSAVGSEHCLLPMSDGAFYDGDVAAGGKWKTVRMSRPPDVPLADEYERYSNWWTNADTVKTHIRYARTLPRPLGGRQGAISATLYADRHACTHFDLTTPTPYAAGTLSVKRAG